MIAGEGNSRWDASHVGARTKELKKPECSGCFTFLINKWAHKLFYSLYSVHRLAYWAFNLGNI